MGERVLLFPYHPDVELFAEKISELKEYLVVGVYSFQEDRSVTEIVNQKLGCTGSFVEMLEQCDRVLLLDNYRKNKTEKYYEVIRAALDAGKQVAVTPLLEKELDLGAYQGKYTVLHHMLEMTETEVKKGKALKKVWYTIETPVIAVFGLGKNCGKFENQILLKSVLEQEGYDALWVSSNPLGALFGGYTMPGFLYDEQLSFEEKVIRFNHFIYLLSVTKKPDVFLIGVPEGISEFTAFEYHHFAEYPLVIGSAVSVDSAVLCTYFMKELNVEGVENLLHHCREKFGFPAQMLSVGRTAYERMEGETQITYLYLEEDYLQKYYKPVEHQPDSYVGVWEAKKARASMKALVDRLAGNPDAI